MIQAVQPLETTEAARDLVRRCVEGERAAQTRLFREEVRRVHALLHRVLGPNAALEDLIQETFLNVFRSLPRFRGEALLSTWIGGIALNVAYGHLRASPPPPVRLELVPDPRADGPDAEQQVAARQGLRRVYQLLDRMDPRLRIAFSLHVIDGRPLREVAALMSASLVATKTRVWRARRELDKRAERDPLLRAFLDEARDEQGAERGDGR
ncbi:MAG TPA: sigma-70 family RNA polymerase sigma factor [Polyangia bacterium]|jgi:RNA polymerase sigma-70 factor (ECF subfamily)|nr:sigma-70 family RNA polymerase sigma factor [Polyangia bacterium]